MRVGNMRMLLCRAFVLTFLFESQTCFQQLATKAHYSKRCSAIGRDIIDRSLLSASTVLNSNNNDGLDVGAKSEDRKLFYSKKAMKDLGVSEKMTDVLKSLGYTQPSKIQALSFNEILQGAHCIVADQTGSGKTLAYLVPIVQRLLAEYAAGALPKEPITRSPYILIITPTTELANQVAKVVRTLANALKFRSACITAASDMDAEQKRLRLGVEVLVTTPGRLIALMKRDEVFLERVKVAVLDEADILFMDQSFPLQPIGAACPPEAQFIFTTATLPASVTDQIKAEFPDVLSLKGPGLHRIAPNVDEIIIDCSGPQSQSRSYSKIMANKKDALLRAMEERDAERTVVFCNTIEQCRTVENLLTRSTSSSAGMSSSSGSGSSSSSSSTSYESGRTNTNTRTTTTTATASGRGRRTRTTKRSIFAYHGALDASTREANLKEFSRALLSQPAVLICTDRASRGMDFDKSPVDHVVLFDFPQEPSEYLRRVGRTGRAGRPGTVTVLVYGKQVAVAKAVVRASVEGKKIEPTDEIR